MATIPPVNLIPVDRYWFLTWTTYGTWLPGDTRGWVGDAPNEHGVVVPHNQPHTPPAQPNLALKLAATRRLKTPPIVLRKPHAEALLLQVQETTTYRQWLLCGIGIMATHLHVLLGVSGDPAPEKLLGDLKAYGSRRLNREWGVRQGGWWTDSGSTRKLDNSASIPAVMHYIRQQENPLLIWTRDEGRIK
jgi:REP element-mobilizing transposase RayT